MNEIVLLNPGHCCERPSYYSSPCKKYPKQKKKTPIETPTLPFSRLLVSSVSECPKETPAMQPESNRKTL